MSGQLFKWGHYTSDKCVVRSTSRTLDVVRTHNIPCRRVLFWEWETLNHVQFGGRDTGRRDGWCFLSEFWFIIKLTSWRIWDFHQRKGSKVEFELDTNSVRPGSTRTNPVAMVGSSTTRTPNRTPAPPQLGSHIDGTITEFHLELCTNIGFRGGGRCVCLDWCFRNFYKGFPQFFVTL